ncbi:MAG: hypothetical protein CR984_07240 [Proteobacteria bacterium]|nr:MAG: hypothetical protein CR984_07240 [Pseudomonadota bacterium]PIE67410.1 MAG: hypothetical protein CSA23_03955 [Deltaproteobacteria bacterium]
MAPLPYQEGISKDIATGVMATLAIFAMSVFMPIVGFLFSIFIPLPVLFYRTKLGRRNGLLVPAVAIALMGLIFGRITMDMLFFCGLMVLGFTMSEMFEKAISVEMTILATCAVVLGAVLITIVFYSMAADTGVVAMVTAYVATNLALSVELYRGIGMPQETIDAITGSLDQIQYVMVRILPSLAAAATLFAAWTNLIAARPIMQRSGLAYPDFGRLNHWRAPDMLIWGVIACGLVMLVPDTDIRLLGINGLVVLLTVYFIQGIAIVSFFFEKKKLPRTIRIVLYTMIAIQQFFLLLVVCIGLFDMWIDFRKIDTKKQEPDLPA